MAATDLRKRAHRKTRVLVVDGHPIVREGLAQLLSRQPDMTYIGGAGTAADARKAVAAQKPDVVIVEITLQEGSGLDLIEDIHKRHPDVLMLVFSMHKEAIYAERTLRAGARGYLMKTRPSGELIKAIRKILAGQIYLCTRVNQAILMRLSGGKSSSGRAGIRSLTDREIEVFRMMGEGQNTVQIASSLHLSRKTVESHRENMKKKLHCGNGTELLQAATVWLQNGGSWPSPPGGRAADAAKNGGSKLAAADGPAGEAR